MSAEADDAALLDGVPRQRAPYGSAEAPSSRDGRRTGTTSIRDRFLRDFRPLSTAPRELWVVYVLTFLISYSLFSFSVILTLFLTREHGVSDMDAGWVYGVHGIMVTIFGFGCGWLIDYLGVRSSLLLGSVIAFFSRLVLAFSTSRTLVVATTMSVLPFSEALGAPIMSIAVKRFSNASNGTVAFALYYTFMNIAALVAGPAVDFCRFFFRDGLPIPSLVSSLAASSDGVVATLSPLRVVLLSSTVTSALLWFVSYFGLRDVELDEDGNVTEFETDQTTGAAERTWAVLREPSFWRLTMLSTMIIGARTVFRHNEATLPKYLLRKFGKDAPFGLVFAINPAAIIVLVPIVGVLSTRMDSFNMIMYGSIASGLSPFCIVVSETYLGVIAYMAIQSMGEAIYSPRTIEYAMKLSARGSEGLYSSLSHAPMFAVQLVVGGMSGWLLTDFMPAGGPYHGKTLWAIIGGVSASTPVLLCLAQSFLRVPEPERKRIEEDDGGTERVVSA